MKTTKLTKIIIASNLFLSLFLWFLYSTDYSLPGNFLDIIFPPLAAFIAIISLPVAIHGVKQHQLAIIFVHLPAIIGGIMYVLMGIAMFFPPFTLGAISTLTEISDEIEIQRADSPDGVRTAYVYFRGVGAYTGGNGRTFVRVKHKLIPFLERDVFALIKSYASEESSKYIEWLDDNTLYISETNEEIPVGVIKGEIPQVIIIPIQIVRSVSAMLAQGLEKSQQTELVRDVPVYPGNITHDDSMYNKYTENVERFIHVDQERVEKIEQWYEEALTASSWRLIQVDHNTYLNSTTSLGHVEYCVQAVREIDGEEHFYFIEFSGTEDEAGTVIVRIGTPNPITDACLPYIENP
jgi:hypothetical protein